MLKTICTELHVYDEDAASNYVPCDADKEQTFFALQRKFLPGGARA